MPKFRIDNYKVKVDGKFMFVAEIQMKDFLLWHEVTKVVDEDEQYVDNRAIEILDILLYPNR